MNKNDSKQFSSTSLIDALVKDVLTSLEVRGVADGLDKNDKKNLRARLRSRVNAKGEPYNEWSTRRSELLQLISAIDESMVLPGGREVPAGRAVDEKGSAGTASSSFLTRLWKPLAEWIGSWGNGSGALETKTAGPSQVSQNLNADDWIAQRLDHALDQNRVLKELASTLGFGPSTWQVDVIVKDWLLGEDGEQESGQRQGAATFVYRRARNRATLLRRLGVNERLNDEETWKSIIERLKQPHDDEAGSDDERWAGSPDPQTEEHLKQVLEREHLPSRRTKAFDDQVKHLRDAAIASFHRHGVKEASVDSAFDFAFELLKGRLDKDIEQAMKELESQILWPLDKCKIKINDDGVEVKKWACAVKKEQVTFECKKSKFKSVGDDDQSDHSKNIEAYFKASSEELAKIVDDKKEKFEGLLGPLIKVVRGHLDFPIAAALREHVFNFWFSNKWQDPKDKSSAFRRTLQAIGKGLGPGKETWLLADRASSIDAMEHVAIGAAVQTIDENAHTRYYPDDWLTLLDEEGSVGKRQRPKAEERAADSESYRYLDWVQTMGVGSPEGFPFGAAFRAEPGEGWSTIQSRLKTQLMNLVGKITTEHHADRSVYFTEREAKPVLAWLKTAGDAAVAVDEDGLIAIVLRCRKTGGKASADNEASIAARHPDARYQVEGRWTVERIDNVATILSHLVRRALGDRVAGGVPYAGDSKENQSKWREGYVIGALEVGPVPLESLTNDKCENASDDLAKIAEAVLRRVEPSEKPETSDAPEDAVDHWANLTARQVRSEETPEAFISKKNALQALVGRLIVKRDQILSITEKLKRDLLAAPVVIPLHRTLAIVIAALGGVFFGFTFSRTFFEQEISPSWLVFLLLALVPSLLGLSSKALKNTKIHEAKSENSDEIINQQQSKENRRRFTGMQVISSLASSFIISLLFARLDGIFSVNDAFALSVVLLAISLFLAWRLAGYDGRVQQILNLENLGPLQSRASEDFLLEHRSQTKWTRRFLRGAPWLLLLSAIIFLWFDFTSALKHLDPGNVRGDHAQYDDVVRNAAWVLPVISLGILISIWNRFGESSAITMVHMVVHRRMRQIQGLMKAHRTLAARLSKRGEPFMSLGLPDMEAEAEMIEPHAELVKDHQDMARGIFLRRTAVVAAAVLAILQFDTLKELVPIAETPPTAEKMLSSAFVDLLDGPHPPPRGGGVHEQQMSWMALGQDGDASAPATFDVAAIDDTLEFTRLLAKAGTSKLGGGAGISLDELLETCRIHGSDEDSKETYLDADRRGACLARNFNRLLEHATSPSFDADDIEQLRDDVAEIAEAVNVMKMDVSGVKDRSWLIAALGDLRKNSRSQTTTQKAIEDFLTTQPPGESVTPRPAQLYPTFPEECGGDSGQDKLIARIFYHFGKRKFDADHVACVATYGASGVEGEPVIEAAFLPLYDGTGDRERPHACEAAKATSFAEIDGMLRGEIERRLGLDDGGSKADAGRFVLLAGFADNDGVPGANIQISRQRAHDLKEALGDRLEVSLAAIGRGEEISAAFLQHRFSGYASHSRRVDVRICDFQDGD